MPIVIGLDLGTTTCKALAVNENGDGLSSATSTYTLHSPRPGWVEQNAEDVWQAVQLVLKTISSQLAQSGSAKKEEVIGISLSGAMHSLLPVDAAGSPLAPAQTWADRRADPQAEAIRRETQAHDLYLRTGCPAQSVYNPARLRWWKQASGLEKVTRYAAIKDWIIFKLAKVWATDASLASTTGLLDIRSHQWDAEAMRLAGVNIHELPELISPFAIAGRLTPDTAHLTGLAEGLPVVAGASDGPLANLGIGAYAPGQDVVTVGTSGAIRRILDQPELDELERTWCYIFYEGRWVAGGAINNGGLAIQWTRQLFYPELPVQQGFDQLIKDAARIDPGAEGVLLLPYFTGERSPYWNTDACAALINLRLGHTRAHVARAALEGVAYCLADVWQALQSQHKSVESASSSPVRLTGGITRDPLWVQILSNVLGVPMAVVAERDASVAGAAILGHQALGSAKLEDLASRIKTDQAYQPDSSAHAIYLEGHKAFQGAYKRVEM